MLKLKTKIFYSLFIFVLAAGIFPFFVFADATTPPAAPTGLVVIDPNDKIAPTIPTNLSATAASCSQINLSWSASTDNIGGSGLKGYKVYRAGIYIATTAATNYSDIGLTGSTAYSYVVSAIDNARNESAKSSATSATTPACPDITVPSVPTGLTATAISCSQINLSWSASTDTGGSGLKGYNVYRNGSYLKQVQTPSTSTSDTGLAVSTLYSYAVSAIDNAGNESAKSNATSATTPACPDVTPPSVSITNPPSGTAYTTAQTVTITATASDNVDVTKVEFYDGSTLMGTGTTSPYSYSWTFTSANNGTHNWTAKAYDGAGNTAISSAVTLMVNIAAASFQWFRQIGGSDQDKPVAVTTDRNGDVLVIGTFRNTVDFGGGPVSAVGGVDGFLARYFSTGGYVWSRRLGGTGNDTPVAITIDTNDDILVTGVFEGTIDLGGGPLVATSGGADIFIAKFSSTGSYLWSKRIGGSGGVSVADIAADTSGGFFLTGSIYGGDLGDGTLRDGLFLARYSGQGVYLWSRAFQSAVGLPKSVGIAVSGTNEVFLVASHWNSIDLGGGLLNPVTVGNQTLFIAKYSASAGDHLWSKRFGGTLDVKPSDIVAHEGGDFTVVGALSGTADFGGGPMAANQSSDAFVVTYSSDGTYRWAKHFGALSSGTTNALGVAAAGAGSVAVTGFFQGYVDFGGGTFFGTSHTNTFVAKYSSTGAHLWSKWYGEPTYGGMDTQGKSVIVDSAGATIAAGQFNYSEHYDNGQWVPSTIDFGTGPMRSNGAEDIFLLKLGP